MIIYKVPKRENGDEHSGYFWTLSKREANEVFKKYGAKQSAGDKIQTLEIAMNKHDVIRFLNDYCDHPDNG